MPFTARTLLQWTSHLGTSYTSSRSRKTLWWHAYLLACLLLFDRMVLSCCLPSCSYHIYPKPGAKVRCQSPHRLTVSEFCDCLGNTNSEEERKHLLESYNLEFCDILSFWNQLAVIDNVAKCKENLKKIVEADCGVYHDNSNLEDIVSRIDCRQRYSVRWTCKDCKIAYKEFLCTSKVLPLILTENKSACKYGSCLKVLKRCPYFLPDSDSQWSGQSVFECNLEMSDSPNCLSAAPSKDQSSNIQTITKGPNSNGS